ncbi:retrovirus-related pol polyprotein from transposon TNT 1-94 [Tanacetum coccineum]
MSLLSKLPPQLIDLSLTIMYDLPHGCSLGIWLTHTLEDEIGIDDSFRYPPDEFIHKDDPSRQYQTDSDISYYIIPYGRSLTELTQQNHVPKVIALNEPDIPHTENTKNPPDIINTEGTPEQNVQNDLMIIQPTKVSSGYNTEAPGPINESLVPDVTHSHILNQASTSMLTRSMDAKLTAALACECLFADFLSEIEPEKVSEALKHPGWNKKDEHGIITKNKARLVAQCYSQEEGINYDETFTPVARMEAIIIFLAFATYMNFKPPGFESNEFPDYVYKLDKALYGLKQAPKAWYETLSTFLIQNKFVRGRIDNTLFIYRSKGEVLLVQVYVDDIIFGSTSYKLCKQFEKLMTKKFEMSMMGELTYFLGLQIKQDNKEIAICQEQYTRNILKKYEISDSSLVKTPMVPPNNLWPDLAEKPVNETSYKGMIGSLVCLKGTPCLGLYYPKCSGFDLKGYLESNYDGCNMDRKSTSAEAEYVATVGCCANILDEESTHKAFTQCPLVVYQNCLREFWSIAVAFDPSSSTDENEQRPLRGFLIKFSVLNGERPLTLDFATFCSSKGLDYNNGQYAAHPTPKTVLGGNYSSTEQVNFIQQLLAYSLITGTEVGIGEIIYNDLVTKLLSKNRLKYVSYPRFISCSLQVLLGCDYTQDENFGFLPGILSNSNFTKDPSKVTDIELTDHMIAVNNRRDSVSPPPFSAKKKKRKSQTMTSTLPQSQGPEASGALSKKRSKPKSKKPCTKTKVSPSKPTEGFKQSHSVSSGTVPDPQDLERNIQLAIMRLPSILNEGTRTS